MVMAGHQSIVEVLVMGPVGTPYAMWWLSTETA